ncbi:hypothetical protein MMC22_007064 [Lobaria immixta]|nr:hypothetical protein [Lobaria immixta]
MSTSYESNFAPGQLGVTQSSKVHMLGGCDGAYGKFHADLSLYSMDRAHYCQLWNRNRDLNDLVPSDGTFLPGSEHTLESDGWNGFTGNIDTYYWADQNFQVSVDVVVMVCGVWYYTDAAGQNQTPSVTTCALQNDPCATD